MEYIKLGKTSREVSRIGLGGMAFGGQYGSISKIDGLRTIHQAIDLGVTYFDTSSAYGDGRAEEWLGEALGSHLDRVCIASKSGTANDPESQSGRIRDKHTIIKQVEASLKRLRRDWIDLYQIDGQDPYTPVSTTMEALLELKEKGKVRFIGTRDIEPGHLRSSLRHGVLDAVEAPYNILNRTPESGAIPFTRATGMSFLVCEPFCCGLLHGHLHKNSSFDQGDRRILDKRFRGQRYRDSIEIVNRLRTFAEQEGLSMTQLALGWLLQNSSVSVVICGAKRPQHIRDVLIADKTRLTTDQLEMIDNIVGEVKYEQPV